MTHIPAVALIDWFSFTLPNDAPHDEYAPELIGLSKDYLQGWYAGWGSMLPHPTEWLPVTSNKPFKKALHLPGMGIRMEWGGGSDRLLVSIPGRGCQQLRAMGAFDKLLAVYGAYASRIDFAVDMECDTRPAAFVNMRTSKRHKNLSFMTSEEGETCYVGSWSSDRFARVYRYNPPHERAQYLRAEHIFRGKEAGAFVRGYLRRGNISAMEFVKTIYGWADEHWTPEPADPSDMEEFRHYKPERHVSKTLKWLEDVCVPAAVRLTREGEIENIYEWFEERVMIALHDSRDKIDTVSMNLER